MGVRGTGGDAIAEPDLREMYNQAKAMSERTASGAGAAGAAPMSNAGAATAAPAPGAVTEQKIDSSPAGIAQREAEILAIRALKRDGYDDADLKDIPLAQQVALGKKALDRQAKLDEEFKRLKGGEPPGDDLAERSDTAARTAGKRPATRQAADGVEDEAAATRQQAYELDDALLEEMADPDAAAKLKREWKRLNKELTDLRASAQTQQQQRQAYHAELLDTRAALIQRELALTFKAIPAEGDVPAEYEKQVARLIKSGGYDLSTLAGMRELLTDSAHITYGHAARQQAQAELIDESRKLTAGQPTRATSHQMPGRTLSENEMQRLMYEAAKRFPNASDKTAMHEYFNSLVSTAQAA